MSLTRVAKLFVFSVILVLIVWIVVATIYYCSNRSKATVSGGVLGRYAWPESLVELLGEADRRQIHVAQLEVYSGLRDDYYWKCDATPELLDLMIACWKLSPVNRNHRVVDIGLRDMPLALSSLVGSNDIDYYVSAELLPGGEWKGHLYCVINDKTTKVLVVRYYYSF